jgi:hypothetical protein
MADNLSFLRIVRRFLPRASRPYYFVISVLSIAITVLVSATAAARRSSFAEADTTPTFGNGALEHRLQMVRDKFGRISPDGLLKAKRHVDRMRARSAVNVQAGAGIAGAASAPAAGGASSSAAGGTAPAMARTAWRWLGPANVGGRVRTLVVHPTNPSVILAGTAGGGIWRTGDGGATWAPVDDFLPALSVSSIVIDPRNANTMYAATGEGYRNADAILGAGIFKSTDGGTTWSQMPATAGDIDFRYSGTLSMSADGQVLLGASSFVIARSTDGGASFTKVTPPFAAVQVLFHPTRSNQAVAAGYGGGALYSKDGGISWSLASGFAGIPNDTRVELAWAASDPDTVYASVDHRGGWLYKSMDGGVSYTAVYKGTFGLTCCQGWYAQAIWVNPKDAAHVVVGGGQISESFDGGLTWTSLGSASPGMHMDQHTIAADPRFDNVSNRTVYFGNDGGVYKADILAVGPSPAPGFTALNETLGITQFYGGAGNAATGTIIGGTQDNGTNRYGPSAGTTWTKLQGGDNGYVANDPTDPNVFYTTYTYLSPFRTTDAGATWVDIGAGIKGQTARFIPPLVLDPNNSQTLLVGGDRLYRTTNAKDPSPAWAGIKAPVPGNDYISAITVVPGDSDAIFVGHTGGRLFKTVNGTSATPVWTELSIPTQGLVTRVTISPSDRNVVYVTTGSFSSQNIWKSANGGTTWASITGADATALPAAPVHDIEVDPNSASTLYAATDIGLYVSTDGGASWQAPSVGPANTRIEELFWMGTTMIAVTHGRGMFALDFGGMTAPTTPSGLRVTF